MINRKVKVNGKEYQYKSWLISEEVARKIIRKWSKYEIYKYFRKRGLIINDLEFDDDTTTTIKLCDDNTKIRLKQLIEQANKLIDEIKEGK